MKDADRSVSNQKLCIRRRILSLLHDMTQGERNLENAAITDHLFTHAMISAARTVCIYASLPEEAGTYAGIDGLLRRKKIVAVPRITGSTLLLHRISSVQDLLPGMFGIPEPDSSSRVILPGEVDVFIVPGIAFDTRGHRLGRGKGYYDTLLSGVLVPVIGLAFDVQVIADVPYTSYDVPVTNVITYNGLLIQ